MLFKDVVLTIFKRVNRVGDGLSSFRLGTAEEPLSITFTAHDTDKNGEEITDLYQITIKHIQQSDALGRRI